MYRVYRYMPEVNKPCCRASYERGYNAHMDALKRIKSSKPAIDNSRPITPQTIGRNYKRYENEQQRNQQIQRDNRRLVRKMESISREEHFPRAAPQRPYTLQGRAQKDEMMRITRDNHKLLNAVQERKPILNRNDWFLHKLDHEYQTTKMSEYRETVPMSDIIRSEVERSSRPTTGGASSRRSVAISSRQSVRSSRRADL